VKTTWKWAKSTWTVADRALQRSTAEVLSAIYEQNFLPCSFGGRPKLGADHDLATLIEVIAGGKTGWEAYMVREKALMLGRTFQLDASASFGKRVSMRFRAPPRLRAPCLGALNAS
jgi:hypothetical protein